MFIGKMGFQQNFQTSFLLKQHNAVSKLQQITNQTKITKNRDTFTSLSNESKDVESIGIYSKSNRLTSLMTEAITYTQYVPPEDLTKELLPPSEKDYTERDALLHQYSKQYSLKDGKLFAAWEVSDEELESYKQELIKNNGNSEIDWQEVRFNFSWNDINFGNAQKLEQKVDYVSSRYAVLKDRIENQYTGEEKEKNMQILNDMYDYGKKTLVDSYSKNIGGFFEDFGQSGISENMKNSLLSAIDQKTAEYENYLAQNNNYASISNEKDTWLYQDDAFMAAQLRKSKSIDTSKEVLNYYDSSESYHSYNLYDLDFSKELQENLTGKINSANIAEKESSILNNNLYSFEDLKFAAIYAKTLQYHINDTFASNVRYNGKDDAALGKRLAEEYQGIKNVTSQLNISQNMKQTAEKIFKPFVNKLLDKMDEGIDRNRKETTYNDRLNYIDRNVVFATFSN